MSKVNTKGGAEQVAASVESQAAAEEQKNAAAPQPTEAPTPAPTEAPTPAPTEAVVIAPTPVTPAPKAVAKPIVVNASMPVAANAGAVEALSGILKTVPDANQIDINRIQIYLERMAPKRAADPRVGTQEQVALYRAIQNIINRQDEYFTQLFSALLFLFKTEGKAGALSDRFRMRFMDNIPLPAGDRKAFANITQMLHILADPKSRSLAMKQVNMERALENGLTAEGRDRVLNYFGA
jgi:glucose/arabinose dehydrogenase